MGAFQRTKNQHDWLDMMEATNGITVTHCVSVVGKLQKAPYRSFMQRHACVNSIVDYNRVRFEFPAPVQYIQDCVRKVY